MDDCRRISKYQLIKEEFIATTPKYSEDEYIEINLNFSFSVESFLWGVRHEEGPRLLMVSATDPGKEYRVRLSSNQLSNFEEETRQFVVEELKEMAMSHGRRKKMVDYALKAALQIVNEHENSYGVLNLQFKVVLECHCLLNLDEVLGPSSFRMVPTADSSIEGLKTVAVDSRRDICCSICLEEFSDDCGQGLAMPCSHIFHGDCIKTWLRTSHYCPLCRFEMPTN